MHAFLEYASPCHLRLLLAVALGDADKHGDDARVVGLEDHVVAGAVLQPPVLEGVGVDLLWWCLERSSLHSDVFVDHSGTDTLPSRILSTRFVLETPLWTVQWQTFEGFERGCKCSGG